MRVAPGPGERGGRRQPLKRVGERQRASGGCGSAGTQELARRVVIGDRINRAMLPHLGQEVVEVGACVSRTSVSPLGRWVSHDCGSDDAASWWRGRYRCADSQSCSSAVARASGLLRRPLPRMRVRGRGQRPRVRGTGPMRGSAAGRLRPHCVAVDGPGWTVLALSWPRLYTD